MRRTQPIPEDIAKEFDYDATTGNIYRTVRQGNYAAGTLSGAKDYSGRYLTIRYKGKSYLAHRVAWFMYYKEQPPNYIDHINRNGLDNRIANLRPATASENQRNIEVTSRSTTGLKGIMPVRGGTLFRAEVCVQGKRYQKHSKSIEKLQEWVTMKRQELHGEYAR